MSRRPVLFVVPDGAVTKASPEKCRSCGAPVAWITTAAGKWMPLSLAKAERNVLGETVAPSHFSDCEFAAQHRRAR